MKKLLIVGLLLYTMGAMGAMGAIKEHNAKKSVYFNIESGLHSLRYDLANGDKENKQGYTFNLGYNHFFLPNWGVKSGLGFSTFKSKAILNYKTNKASVDTDNESFNFRTQYSDWNEQQNLLLMDITLGLIYQLPINEKWKFQFSFGPKLSFPVQAKYQTTGGVIKTTGYYQQYNVILSDMPQHNFKSLTEFPDNDIHINTVISAFADLGGVYKINEKFDLYLGAYIDYGLNNIIDAQNKSLYQEDGIYNGVFESNQTDKIKLFTFGCKIGLTWKLK